MRTGGPAAMARPVLRDGDGVSTNERAFVLEALRAELRVDGRRPFDVRPLRLELGRRDGTAEVALGDTRVLAVASAELAAPFPDRPNEGSLAVNVELSPLASPAFEPGRPSEVAVELMRGLERTLRDGGAVDREALCVLAGRKAWALRLDLHVVDHGGGLAGATSLAALAALLTFRKPETTVDATTQEVTVHPLAEREGAPLCLHHLPVTVQFALFEGELCVVDPLLKEEAAMGGHLAVTVNQHREVCAVQKAGGIAVGPDSVMRCARVAANTAAALIAELRAAVEAHDKDRLASRVRRHTAVDAAATPGDLVLTDADLGGPGPAPMEEEDDGDEAADVPEAGASDEGEDDEDDDEEGSDADDGDGAEAPAEGPGWRARRPPRAPADGLPEAGAGVGAADADQAVQRGTNSARVRMPASQDDDGVPPGGLAAAVKRKKGPRR